MDYGNGNLAYKDYYSPEPKRTPQQNKAVRRNHSQMLNRRKNMRRICAVLVLSLAAGFMISEFVSVQRTKQEVKTLYAELQSAQADTSQKNFDLESSMDLATIEKEATTRLGMQRPEKYQMIYVNVTRDDVTEKTAGEEEGFFKSIARNSEKVWNGAVELFSIK